MELTLHWLLHKSDIKDLKLCSCPDAEDTIVTGVNIIDNPDTVQWVKPGEFVLTTGYFFVDDPQLQQQILTDLKSAGCAALAIKTKRFFEKIPTHMISFSEQIGLSLIELPYYYSLSDISAKISYRLYQNQLEETASEQLLYNALFSGYFQGKPLNDILGIFSGYLHCSLFILNQSYEILWYALRPKDREELTNEHEEPAFSIPPSAEKNMNTNLFTSAVFSFGGNIRRGILIPFSNPDYTLCILTDFPELLPWDVIHQVLKIIDFSRVNSSLRRTADAGYYDSFFRYMLDKDSFSQTSVLQLYEYYGIPAGARAVCALMVSRDKKQRLQAKKLAILLKDTLSEVCPDPRAFFIAFNSNQICLFCFDQAEQLLPLTDSFVREQGLCMGVSRKVSMPLADAFGDASFMLSMIGYFPEETVFYFQDYLIFWQISKLSQEQKQEIYETTVKPLVDFDAANDSCLTQTLLMYYQCHLNSSLAASKLYIHRNTFLKRMEKIQSLIPFSLENHNCLYSIHFGLCVYRILQKDL